MPTLCSIPSPPQGAEKSGEVGDLPAITYRSPTSPSLSASKGGESVGA